MLIIFLKQPQPNKLGASLAFASPPATSPKCSQAKNRWRVQIMTKKVAACLAICTRSGGEPAAGSFCCWGRLRGRRYPHIARKSVDICHPSDWLPGGDIPVLQDAAGGLARKERINRETGNDDESRYSTCGSQMVPRGECLLVILFAGLCNRAL